MKYALLRIPPQSAPIYLLVRCRGDGTEEAERFLFEKSACPSNYLTDVEEVATGGVIDPHGLAQFVASADADVNPFVEPMEVLRELLRRMLAAIGEEVAP